MEEVARRGLDSTRQVGQVQHVMVELVGPNRLEGQMVSKHRHDDKQLLQRERPTRMMSTNQRITWNQRGPK